jgi:AAA+ ATPase superfamily predicted ATPase
MEFVDRKEEMERLQRVLAADKTSVVVVYGRRRLGKSTLIKRALTDGDVYYLADRSESSHQRILLAKVIALRFPDFDKVSYPDWESLFRALNYRADKRFALCLDEFPYMAEQSPELPSVLQKLIDEKQLRYHIILCGSSQNMMYGLFLDGTSPLYGRTDVMMRLTPLRLPYLHQALHLPAEQAVEEYAVWGGVPRYWELREGLPSLREALWQNVLSVNGTLYEEPIKLFQDDVKDIVKTATLMSYIGAGANRLSEIAARCNEPATNLSRPLKKLIDLGFIEKELPFGVDEKNAKKSLYRIADPFMAFYYRFVGCNRSFIELDRRRPIEEMLDAHFTEFVGLQWERMCRNFVTGNEIAGALYGPARRWWGSVMDEAKAPVQIELDVVAESMDRRYLLVGECKWTEAEDAERLTAQLLRKARLLPFAEGHVLVPVLFLKRPPMKGEGRVFLPQDVILAK